jgi:hypothetical protein
MAQGSNLKGSMRSANIDGISLDGFSEPISIGALRETRCSAVPVTHQNYYASTFQIADHRWVSVVMVANVIVVVFTLLIVVRFFTKYGHYWIALRLSCIEDEPCTVANENLTQAFGTRYPAAGYRSPGQLREGD